MNKKVILISIDGMRPDGMKQTLNPFVKELEAKASYTYEGRSVFPSVTLPCHYSMSHSVEPMRHGILTNAYAPEVRPVPGIFEVIKQAGGACAMFYGWENMRDIARPGSLRYATYIHTYAEEYTDRILTEEAIARIEKDHPDFVFLYMADTDDKGGHAKGWMSEEYIRRVSLALDNTKTVVDKFSDEYTIILMSDHGGHDRTHGTEMPEDMTIPLFFLGEDFEAGAILPSASLLDIAPTIVDVMGIARAPEWEGISIVNKRG